MCELGPRDDLQFHVTGSPNLVNLVNLDVTSSNTFIGGKVGYQIAMRITFAETCYKVLSQR